MRDSEPLSLDELRPLLRYRRGRRSLLRQLEAHEVLRGVRFVVRHHGPERTRYSVTLASLRRYAPDLLPPELRDPAVGDVSQTDRTELRRARNQLALLDDKIEEVAIEVVERRVQPQIDKLREALRKNP